MNSDIICVFGGTFNPVHTGHIEIARHVHSQFNLDKILIMPSGNPSSYKDTSLIADAKDRMQYDFTFNKRLSLYGTFRA